MKSPARDGDNEADGLLAAGDFPELVLIAFDSTAHSGQRAVQFRAVEAEPRAAPAREASPRVNGPVHTIGSRHTHTHVETQSEGTTNTLSSEPRGPSPEENERPGEQARSGDRGKLGAQGQPGGQSGQGPSGRGRASRNGLLMGRPFGVPVYVGPSWFLIAALITWVFGNQLELVLPELGAVRYVVSFFFAVVFYASVLVHELAHTVVALRFGLPVRRIHLQFFGGVSEIEKEAETPRREFVLAFVGPLLSAVLAAVFYLTMQFVPTGGVVDVLLAGLMASNAIVAAFNLLPGLPLDGGRMLRAVVWWCTSRPMVGTVAAAWVGRALAVAVLVGLPLFTSTRGIERSQGDIVTDWLLAIVLAVVIWSGARNSVRMARFRERLPLLRARSLTRRALPVHADTPLSEALRRAEEDGARGLVVVDRSAQPRALAREAAIVETPEHRRPWVVVSELAEDLRDGMRVSVELAGEELLDALRACPASEYLVVEETGEIFGILATSDVEHAFANAVRPRSPRPSRS